MSALLLIKAQSFLLGVLMMASPAGATSQAPDRMILDGTDVALHTNPLEGYLKTHGDKRPSSTTFSSGLWRRYVAHWEIVDDRLTLSKIEAYGDSDGDGATALEDVTAQYFPEAPMVADWYTGALVIPRGELVSYVHMGYASTYESYTILIIQSGALVERKDLPLKDFEQYKARKFEQFKTTPEYMRQVDRATKELGSKSRAENFLAEFYTEQYLSTAE